MTRLAHRRSTSSYPRRCPRSSPLPGTGRGLSGRGRTRAPSCAVERRAVAPAAERSIVRAGVDGLLRARAPRHAAASHAEHLVRGERIERGQLLPGLRLGDAVAVEVVALDAVCVPEFRTKLHHLPSDSAFCRCIRNDRNGCCVAAHAEDHQRGCNTAGTACDHRGDQQHHPSARRQSGGHETIVASRAEYGASVMCRIALGERDRYLSVLTSPSLANLEAVLASLC